ncbi:hypothetical protein [Falsiroseomonas tokyonensis]|uniref:Uncharacterized protein n=1 Tax=Falsiroseomonas tokyonensis TaxID=430521 RepID=A0ABV7BU37_9PROT|nr:hypothetical protein [Falsiroseomonas tokyonensis]MBU8538734.1 hypothetical protein [Falsiroseomonas tokyonensis]
MSEHETLRALAPADNSPEAIRAAIAKAEAEHAESLRRVAEAQAALPDLLLRGSDAQVTAAEAEASALQRQADRVAVFLRVLCERLAQAEIDAGAAAAQRRKTEVLDAINDANGLAEAFATWMREEYPRLANAIIEGMKVEERAMEAFKRAVSLRRSRAAEIAGMDLPNLRTAGEILGNPRGGGWPVSNELVLPGLRGEGPMGPGVPLWQPARTRGYC